MKSRIEDIPIGRENAITRAQLKKRWNCSDRQVRKIIEHMRTIDNGDGYIIVSHSAFEGYYRSDKREDILYFRAEIRKRLRNVAKPLKKVRRVLNQIKAEEDYGKGLAG